MFPPESKSCTAAQASADSSVAMASSSLPHHRENMSNGMPWHLVSAVSEGPEVSPCREDAPDNASIENISRCSSLIRDSNANLYQRGLAVMVLGKILSRETEEARSRGAICSGILNQYLASKSGAGRDVLDALLDIVGACTPSKSGEIKALSEGCGEADARNIRSNCSVLISLLIAMFAGGVEAAPGVDAHSLRKSFGGSREKVPFLPAVSSSSELFVQMKPQPSPDVIQDSPKKGWAARKELPQPMNDSPRSPSRTRGIHMKSSATRTPSKKRPLTRLATSSHSTPCADRMSQLSQNAATGKGQTLPGEPPLPVCASPFAGPDEQGVDVQADNETDGAKPGSGSGMVRERSQPRPPSPARNAGLFASPPRLGSERRSQGPSPGRRRGGGRYHLARSGAPERSAPLGLSSPGLRQSRSSKSKVWHNVGMSARKASAEGTTAGLAPLITLSATEKSERFGRQPPVRPAVLFGSDLPRERKLRHDCDEADVVAADARLGYQVPRLWIAHAHPETTGGRPEGWASASMGVSMPQIRHRAVEGAKRPVASDAVVQEYQQMQAFRTYRALARSRPVSVEPLHGTAANDKLVELLGRRPETEDGAIARDWSPRGGRKQRKGRPVQEAPVAPEGDDDAAPARSTSPSRSPPRQSVHASSASRGCLTSWMSRSPPGAGRRCMSRMYPRPRVSPPPAMRSRCERPEDLRVTESSLWSPHGPAHDRIDSPEGFSIHPGDTPTRALSEASPPYAACSAGGDVGNLGGWYTSPCSPYRTYRAKHARLARAHSSERAEASKRRRTAREGNMKGWGRRCSSADDTGRRRAGTSGMTSPLLRGEGFGLLESDVTNKISLGFQLPFDRPSPTGRARAAATAAVSTAHAHALELFSGPDSTLLPSDIRRTRRWERGRQPCPEASPLGGLSGTQGSAGERSRGRWAQPLLPLEVSRDGEQRPILIPSERPKRSTSVGSRCVRDMPSDEGGIPRGSRSNRISWSPQRTEIRNGERPKTPTGNVGTGEAGHWKGCSSAGSSSDGDQGFPVGVDHSQRGYQSWVGGDGERVAPRSSRWSRCASGRHPEGVAGASGGHRLPSPLDSPLGRYHASRTVMRAGTVASRRDVVEVERASRRALSALRAVSVVRRRIAKRSRRTRLADGDPCRRRNRRFVDDPEFGQHPSETSGEEQSSDETMLTRIKRSLPSLQLMDRELEAIRRADEAMRDEQLAQVKLNINALPLALLLVHPGGGSEARGFVARALELWLRERMRARLTYAIARYLEQGARLPEQVSKLAPSRAERRRSPGRRTMHPSISPLIGRESGEGRSPSGPEAIEAHVARRFAGPVRSWSGGNGTRGR